MSRSMGRPVPLRWKLAAAAAGWLLLGLVMLATAQPVPA